MSQTRILTFGMAVLVVAGGFALALLKDRPKPVQDTATATAVSELRNDVARLSAAIENQEARRRDRGQASDDALARLERRLAALENRTAAPAPTVKETAPEPDDPAATDEPKAGGKVDDFRALQEKVWKGEATPDEEARFWKMARTTGVVDELITDLEGKVKEKPTDIDSRMNLADAYVAKLLSIPGGPEQGVWAMKAETQWKTVVKQDENHWGANYSIAESWSWYPEQLGKTPDAIKQFEKVRKIQDGMTPDKQHANTYLRLSMLYNRQNNTKKAREALVAGIERHPEHEQLRKALDTMGDAE